MSKSKGAGPGAMARAAAASASASARAARPQMRRAQTKTMKVALIPKPITVVTRFSPDPSIPPRKGHRSRTARTHALAAREANERDRGAALSRLPEQAAAYKSGAAGLGLRVHRRGVWDLGADAYLGRYWTFVVGSAIYLMGMLLLTLSVSVGALKPPECVGKVCPPASALQVGIYFGGLYIIALGNGGTKPNISTIGADQFDDFDPREKSHKLSFFNWWMFTIFVGILFSSTVLVYLQDNVSWSIGYGIPTLGLVASIVIFLAGTPVYRHKLPQGSAFTRMGKVVGAAVRKWRLPVPADAKELHELELEAYTKKHKFRMDSTNSMKFLNKAAVKEADGSSSAAKWSLCTVTEVEETKQIVKLIPLLVTMFVPCTLIAQTNTLFVKQGTTMNRHVGPGSFEIPPASLGAFVTLTMLVVIVVYDRLFVKAVRRHTKNPRGISLLTRMGIGMLVQVLTMGTASLIESRRLSYARSHGTDGTGGELRLSIFVLLPQFVLMGLADAFLVVGKIEFFYDQAPESMKSLGTALSLTAYGVGNVLSSFILSLVTRVTRERGSPWVTNDLNASHLDYYYAFLTLLAAANCLVFAVLARRYKYRAESTDTIDVDMDVQAQRDAAKKIHSEPMA